MSKTAKNSGGIIERFILVSNPFKVKFEYWPIEMEAHLGTIATLATWHLTPHEFLKRKLLKVRPELVALLGVGCGR